MTILFFCHSVRSDWNNGNAHFLRGVARALTRLGHAVRLFEPEGGWSVSNLLAHEGAAALDEVSRACADLDVRVYAPASLDLDEALEGAEVVVAHEWNEPALLAGLAARGRGRREYRLLFHDTHHRSVTAPAEVLRPVLDAFDGVLAFGEVIRERYAALGIGRRAWTWHEAADTTRFRPLHGRARRGLVWVGNWGDEERTAELETFLFAPVEALGIETTVHGVRYPPDALARLARAGCRFAGWLPNHRVPQVFARHAVTVHVPRRAYASRLPGIPTIRVFEALACGIPLVSAPWADEEGLFAPDRDFLTASTGEEMTGRLRDLLHDPARARELAEHGRRTVLARHTCDHRARELVAICDALGAPARPPGATAPPRVATAPPVGTAPPASGQQEQR
jgi:spore maturation protein CgeB